MSDYQLTFPLLPPSEIVTCTSELGIPLTERELKNPTPELVMSVLDKFVACLMSVDRETIRNTPLTFGAAETLTAPDELHENSVPEVEWHRALSKLMEASFVRDFSVNDINKPTGARLRRVLSGLINFAKFREDRLVTYENLATQISDNTQHHMELKEKKERLAAQVAEIEAARDAEADQVAEIEEQNQGHEHEIQMMNKAQADLKAEVANMKSVSAELTEALTQKKIAVLNVRQEVDKLQGQIVDEPDKMKSSLVSMSGHLQAQRSDLAALESRVRVLQGKDEALDRVLEDMRVLLGLVDEVDLEVAKLKKLYEEVTDVQKRVDGAERQQKELDILDTQLRTKSKLSSEKAEKQRRADARRREEVTTRLASLRENRINLEREKYEAETAVSTNTSTINSLRMQIAQIKTSHQMEISALLAKYQENVIGALEKYHSGLEGAMKSVGGYPEDMALALAVAEAENSNPQTAPRSSLSATPSRGQLRA